MCNILVYGPTTSIRAVCRYLVGLKYNPDEKGDNTKITKWKTASVSTPTSFFELARHRSQKDVMLAQQFVFIEASWVNGISFYKEKMDVGMILYVHEVGLEKKPIYPFDHRQPCMFLLVGNEQDDCHSYFDPWEYRILDVTTDALKLDLYARFHEAFKRGITKRHS